MQTLFACHQFYLGVSGGFSNIVGKRSDTAMDLPPAGTPEKVTIANNKGLNSVVANAGIFAGCLFRIGNFGIGPELSYSYCKLENTTNGQLVHDSGYSTAFEVIKHMISNQIGVTGRFGVFLDKYFLYGLAGLQLSANRFYAQAREREFFFSYDTTTARRKNTGLLIGAGIQKALVDNIEIGIEFKYAKLGNKTYTYNVNDGYNTTLTSKINYNMSTIAVRLVYAF